MIARALPVRTLAPAAREPEPHRDPELLRVRFHPALTLREIHHAARAIACELVNDGRGGIVITPIGFDESVLPPAPVSAPLPAAAERIGECELCGLVDHHLRDGACPSCAAKYQAVPA